MTLINVSQFECWCIQNDTPINGASLLDWVKKYPLDFHSWFLSEHKMKIDDAAADEREGAINSMFDQFERLLGREVIVL